MEYNICVDCSREVSLRCRGCIHYRLKGDYYKAKPEESTEQKKANKALSGEGQNIEEYPEYIICTDCKTRTVTIQGTCLKCKKDWNKALKGKGQTINVGSALEPKATTKGQNNEKK